MKDVAADLYTAIYDYLEYEHGIDSEGTRLTECEFGYVLTFPLEYNDSTYLVALMVLTEDHSKLHITLRRLSNKEVDDTYDVLAMLNTLNKDYYGMMTFTLTDGGELAIDATTVLLDDIETMKLHISRVLTEGPKALGKEFMKVRGL